MATNDGPSFLHAPSMVPNNATETPQPGQATTSDNNAEANANLPSMALGYSNPPGSLGSLSNWVVVTELKAYLTTILLRSYSFVILLLISLLILLIIPTQDNQGGKPIICFISSSLICQ